MTRKIKIFEITVTYGAWKHVYPMCACSSCGAIVKAMDTFGQHVRISAKQKV